MSLIDIAKHKFRNVYLARFGETVSYAGTSIKASIDENRKARRDSDDGRALDSTMTISVSTTDVAAPAVADVVTYGGATYQVVEILNIDPVMGSADLLIEKQDDIERTRPGFRRR